ncbi:MAG: GtrA family protein [Verrucomicrobiales bacterium]|nr:GtrA family protein [Verrucomicrobiales bacterium]
MIKGIGSDFAAFFSHLKSHGWRRTLHWLHSKEAPVTFQFAKYVLFGGITTIVHLALFTLLSHQFFPAHDYLVEGGIEDSLKERNAILSNLIAFPFAAAVNYVFNVLFVFTSGRHSRFREMLLFLGISFLSFAVGLFSGPVLISRGLDPWIAQAALMVSSALVNFLCRKFLIFLK